MAAGRRGKPTGWTAWALRRWRWGLAAWFLALAVLTAWKGLAYYHAHSGWTIGDWLVNDHFGWVRRGLLGDGLLALSALTGVNLGLLVWAAQSLTYGLMFAFACRLLCALKQPGRFLPLLFAPFLFTFQLHDGGYRKEILFLALLAAVAWVSIRPSRRLREAFFAAAFWAFPLLVLSHEMLLLFWPYLLGLYLVALPDHSLRRRVLTAVLPAAVSAALVLWLTLRPPLTAAQAEAMQTYLAQRGFAVQGGTIPWMTYPWRQSFGYVLDLVLYHGYVLKYFGLWLLSLAAFWPLRTVWRQPEGTMLARTLALGALASLAVLPLMVDWGRLLYVHLMAAFFYTAVLAWRHPPPPLPARSRRGWALAVAGWGAYALLWHIPVCYCGGHTAFGLAWLLHLLQAT